MKILFITHQLSLSGAPMAVMDMIRAYLEEGYSAEVISLTEGPLSAELDALQVPWRIRSDFLTDWQSFYQEVHLFSAVVVNTLVAYQPIFILKHTNIPTIWWLHETEWFFETYDRMHDITPKLTDLPDNIWILSVSPIVQGILRKRYDLVTQILPLCVSDHPAVSYAASDSDKVRFLTLASWSSVKGQDVLADAICLLPSDVRKKCEFRLYGGGLQSEPDFKQQVSQKLSNIEEASTFDAIPHETALTMLSQCDYCVVPSRYETFSVIAVEAMTFRKPCILTDTCGVAAWLSDRENALISPPEDPHALSELLTKAVEIRLTQAEQYNALCDNARAVYDRNFSREQFRKTITDIFSQLGVAQAKK